MALLPMSYIGWIVWVWFPNEYNINVIAERENEVEFSLFLYLLQNKKLKIFLADVYFFDFWAYTVLFVRIYERRFRMNSFTFAVIGGDRRSFYAAKRLRECGFETQIFGLKNEETYRPFEKINADAVLLPVPFTRDGIHILAPESTEKILISDVLSSVSENSLIFAGNVNNITDNRILDYVKREDFALMNAVPTAEGALMLALQNGKTTVCGMSVAVIGFGKIASAVAKLFSAAGAEITVFARKEQARTEAHILGYTAKPISALAECADAYRLLINTVPSKIFEKNILERIRKDAYIMELASAPFGVDFEEAASLGVRTLLASGLPGKYFPETAGCAVAETVLHVLREKQILF